MRHLLFVCFLVIALPVHAFDHSHSTFDKVLNKVVTVKGPESFVDYDFLDNNHAELDAYLKQLEGVSQSQFDGWNKDQQLAFLINAYNAFTLKLIIDNYPGIDSIRDLGGLIFKSPWDKKFFTLFGKKTNLDHIEHDLIRENYNEPRIHFAVNCASIGCPALQKNVYVADKLNDQLEMATITFMRDITRNRFNKEKKLLEISSIFNWFTGDFTRNGTLRQFVAPYMTDDPALQSLIAGKGNKSGGGIGDAVSRNDISITFLDYDWSLNIGTSH